ncbi:hypothetical protein [Bifidobacterium anseris]|nr:hypothetical protein [Bifidobacterium anseris]
MDTLWTLPSGKRCRFPRWLRKDHDLPELTVKHLKHLLDGSGEKAREDRIGALRTLTVDGFATIIAFGKKRSASPASIHGMRIIMPRGTTPDDLLLGKFVKILEDHKRYREAELLDATAIAGGFAAGFDFAMQACKTSGIVPPTHLVHEMMSSPWFEKGSYADDICQELLKKDGSTIAS